MIESKAFPWLKHLPRDEQDDFFQEIIAMGSVAVDVGWTLDAFVEKLETHIAAWKSTAEVHTDPELLAILTTPLKDGDLVEAPRPQAPLLECGLCYEEDGEEVHPHPECTWTADHSRTPKYVKHSVIKVEPYRGASWGTRYSVLDIVNGQYHLKPLTAQNFDVVLWDVEDCERWSNLEWVNNRFLYGLVEEHLKIPRRLTPDEAVSMGVSPYDGT